MTSVRSPTLEPPTTDSPESSLDLKTAIAIARRIRYCDGLHAGDGEDFAQDALLEMMERARRNGGGLSETEMWRAARCVRNRYRRAYSKRVLSLNAPIQGTEEPIDLWETLADEGTDLDAWLEAKLRLGELPPGILRLARKLENGEPLTRGQQARLVRFRHDGRPNPQQKRATKHYYEMRSKGLCVRCGEQSDGHARCPRCQERHRAYQKRHRRSKGTAWISTLRAYRRKQGRCPRCGRAPEPGRKKCSYCLVKSREYLQQYRELHNRGQSDWQHWYAQHKEEYLAKRRAKRGKGGES